MKRIWKANFFTGVFLLACLLPTPVRADCSEARAAILFLGIAQGKSYLSMLMDEALPMQHEGWMILTRRLALFFAGLAVANELVWRLLSTEAWVNFKTFGLTIALFAFFMTQGKLMERYALPPRDKE